MEVDVRIAALGHAIEDRVHIVPDLRAAREALLDGARVAVRNGFDDGRDFRQHRSGARLDGDVDEHEPRLVLAGEEVLDHPDVVEADRGSAIKPVPIVEHIGRVGQQRLLAEALGQRPHRHGQRGAGREVGGIGLAPDIGLDHEGVADHGRAELGVGRLGAEGFEVQHGEVAQMLPDPGRSAGSGAGHGRLPRARPAPKGGARRPHCMSKEIPSQGSYRGRKGSDELTLRDS
jgi:hypothetical protein